jgi:zinc protease
MANLVITEAALENEKKIVAEELRMRGENSPLTRVLVAAQQAELGKHPYAYDPAGTKEDVAAATVEAARRFYESYYRPTNAHLVIVGDVDAADTIARVETAFAPIAGGGETPPEVPALTDWTYPQLVELKEDLPPVEVAVIGFPLPPADSPDRGAVDLLTHLLSDSAVSPFRENLVVRRRKAIEARCEVIALRRGGALLFASVHLPYRRESTAFRLMDETREELSRLDWLTDERVRGAKRAMKLRDLESHYFASSVAETIGRARWWEGDARRGLDRIARIEAVTREDVAAAYRRYVGSPRPLRLYVRPQHVPLYVRLFGWLYPLVSR